MQPSKLSVPSPDKYLRIYPVPVTILSFWNTKHKINQALAHRGFPLQPWKNLEAILTFPLMRKGVN